MVLTPLKLPVPEGKKLNKNVNTALMRTSRILYLKNFLAKKARKL